MGLLVRVEGLQCVGGMGAHGLVLVLVFGRVADLSIWIVGDECCLGRVQVVLVTTAALAPLFVSTDLFFIAFFL